MHEQMKWEVFRTIQLATISWIFFPTHLVMQNVGLVIPRWSQPRRSSVQNDLKLSSFSHLFNGLNKKKIIKRNENKWTTRCVKVCWQEVQTVASILSVCFNTHSGPIRLHGGSCVQDILANDNEGKWRHVVLLSRCHYSKSKATHSHECSDRLCLRTEKLTQFYSEKTNFWR